MQRTASSPAAKKPTVWWNKATNAPENIDVLTVVRDAKGNETNKRILRRRGSLWFLPDMSSYVYYKPTHWMHKD